MTIVSFIEYQVDLLYCLKQLIRRLQIIIFPNRRKILDELRSRLRTLVDSTFATTSISNWSFLQQCSGHEQGRTLRFDD